MPDLQKIETYLQTNEHLPRISPHLLANELAASALTGLSSPLALLAPKSNLPKIPLE